MSDEHGDNGGVPSTLGTLEDPGPGPCVHHAALRQVDRERTGDEYYDGSGDHWKYDYCPACWSAYLAHMTAERWAALNYMAARQCRPGHYRPSLPVPRPHKPPGEPHARIEKPAQAVRRLTGAIGWDERAARYKGKGPEAGWVMTATDGHRALLTPGEPEKAVALSFLRVQAVSTFTVGQAFHLALRQLAPLANERSHAIRLHWNSRRQVLVLSTRSLRYDDEMSGQVEIDALGTGPDAVGTFDGEYLQDVCGVWPLVLKFPARLADQVLDKPIELAPAFPCFRCVLMPMRD